MYTLAFIASHPVSLHQTGDTRVLPQPEVWSHARDVSREVTVLQYCPGERLHIFQRVFHSKCIYYLNFDLHPCSKLRNPENPSSARSIK